MTQKFGRNYRLTIDPKDGGAQIVVTPPLTCRFYIKRDILADASTAVIDVYNLSLANRRRIFQDRNNIGQTIVNGASFGRKSAQLDVGYGNLLYTIWKGDILIASSAREGVDVVTHIESLTTLFDFAASEINITMAAGTTLKQVFQTLCAQFPSLQIGYISNFTYTFQRPVVLNGKPWDLIRKYATDKSLQPADVFTDNGKIYIMSTQDKASSSVAGGSVPVLNASTGLLETPRREQSYLSITTLMEPGILMNSLVQINSVVEPSFDGQYAVIGIQHSGIISGAVAGDCRSTFFLLKPEFASYNGVQVQ